MRKKVKACTLETSKFNSQGSWPPTACGVVSVIAPVWAKPMTSPETQVQKKILYKAAMLFQEQGPGTHGRKERQTSYLKWRAVGEELHQQETLHGGGTIAAFLWSLFSLAS